MESNVALVEESGHHKSQSPTSSLTQPQQQTATTSSHAGSELVHTAATTVSLPPLGPSVLGPNNGNPVVGNAAGETTTTHHQAHGYGGIANAQPSPSPSPPPSTSTHHSSNSHHHQSQHTNNNSNQQQPPQFLQQPITFIFERFCSNVPPQALSLNTPLPSPQMVVRSVLDSPMDVLDANSSKPLQQQPHINNPSLAPTTTTFHHHPYPYQNHNTPSNTSSSSSSNSGGGGNNTNINSNSNSSAPKKSGNKKKRKQPHPQLQTQQASQCSYRTPIDSPNSMHMHDDSRSEEEYGDSLMNESLTRCEDYDMISPVESLKRLLMQFPAMSPARLNTILPVLLDNDIDDPEILLLIENEKFLRELRAKNGSDISLGNCLLLWHGIQEHQRMNNASAVHTPKSFSSSSSASYSPPPPNLRNADLMLLSHSAPRAKRQKLDIGDKDDSASSTISVSSQELDHHSGGHHNNNHHNHHHHHHHNHQNNIHENLIHKPTMQQQHQQHHHQQHHQQSHHHHNNHHGNSSGSNGVNKQRVKAPKLSMSTIEEVHSRVDCVLRVVAHENERRKQIAQSRSPQAQATLKFEDFVAELKQQHKIPVAFGTLRDMRFAYILKKLHELRYRELLASNRGNVTEFYRTCQEVCEEIFEEEELEEALPWLTLKGKLYYK